MAGRDKTEYMIALELRSGKEVWATPLGPMYENEYGDGPRGTPTVSQGLVYGLTGRGVLCCVEADNGRKLWSVSYIELGGEVPGWGYSESVLADGDQIVGIPGKKGGIVALDRRTGAIRWQTTAWTDEAQYTSLVPYSVDGERQYAALSRLRLAGIHAGAGEIRWQRRFESSVVVTTSPLMVANQIFVSAGGSTGCMSIRVTSPTTVEHVYSNKVMKNLANGLTLSGETLVGYSENRGWVCQNFKNGNSIWLSKDFDRGSIVYVDGRLICLSEETGEVVLAAGDATAWKELSRFMLAPPSKLRKPLGRVWTQPVVSRGRLLLRDQEMLHCFDLRKPPASDPR